VRTPFRFRIRAKWLAAHVLKKCYAEETRAAGLAGLRAYSFGTDRLDCRRGDHCVREARARVPFQVVASLLAQTGKPRRWCNRLGVDFDVQDRRLAAGAGALECGGEFVRGFDGLAMAAKTSRAAKSDNEETIASPYWIAVANSWPFIKKSPSPQKHATMRSGRTRFAATADVIHT
jgi:hypothetical protein